MFAEKNERRRNYFLNVAVGDIFGFHSNATILRSFIHNFDLWYYTTLSSWGKLNYRRTEEKEEKQMAKKGGSSLAREKEMH